MKIKMQKKLVLNKTTVSNLNSSEMNMARAGRVDLGDTIVANVTHACNVREDGTDGKHTQFGCTTMLA